MKHLKTYKNHSFKKYVIFKLPHIKPNSYYFIIAEIFRVKDDKYIIGYHYSNIKNKYDLNKLDSTVIYEVDSIYVNDKEIVFQSDLIEDCINHIKVKLNADNYNI